MENQTTNDEKNDSEDNNQDQSVNQDDPNDNQVTIEKSTVEKLKGSEFLDTIQKESSNTKSTKTPQSFIIKTGKIGGLLGEFVRDLRKVMSPHTPPKLRKNEAVSWKEFVATSRSLGVTHIIRLSETYIGKYMTITRLPEGPTATFKILSFATAKDVFKSQKTPHNLSPKELNLSPLLIMNNFPFKKDEHMFLKNLFKGLFPAMILDKVQLNQIFRTTYFQYDTDETIHFRHFAISTRDAAVSSKFDNILKSKPVNLNQYKDISDFVFGDESLSNSQNFVSESAKRVSLQEIGPRFSIQLIKVETGLYGGTVLFHRYYIKSAAELEQQKIKRNQIKQRKILQQKRLEEKVNQEKEEKEEEKPDDVEEVEIDEDENEDEDIQYYREEVGLEPSDEVKQTLKKKDAPDDVRVPKKYKKKLANKDNEDSNNNEQQNKNFKRKRVTFNEKEENPSQGQRKNPSKPILKKNRKSKGNK